MSLSITEFVKESIYPNLNAAEEGFLDDYSPKLTGSSYICDCPVCGKLKKAYYYPGSGYLICNRKNNCGDSISIWDCLLESGYSTFDALKAMADAAGVNLPGEGEESSKKKVADIVKNVLKQGLIKSKRGMEYMVSQRGWQEQEVDLAPFGYIHSTEFFLNGLRRQGVSEEHLIEWGFLDLHEKGQELGVEFSFDNRIVGWWEGQDGKLKLWGRDVTGRRKCKYRYQDSLLKNMPCYWNEPVNKENRDSLIFVEGPLDASRLIANNVPSVASGGSSISSGMAAFLSTKISMYLHWIDNDVAGHLGAGTSIIKTNSFGIYSTIFSSPIDGVKDADEALNAMPVEQLISLIDENSMGCGEFLAKGFVRALEFGDVDVHAVFSRARLYNSKLQGVAKTEFFSLMSDAGVMLDNPTSSALRAMAELIDLGIDEPQIKKIIRKQYEVNISVKGVQ